MNILKRLKNKTFLVAFAAWILTALQLFGVGIDAGEYNTLVYGAINLAVLLGIVIDPTTDGIKDKVE